MNYQYSTDSLGSNADYRYPEQGQDANGLPSPSDLELGARACYRLSRSTQASLVVLLIPRSLITSASAERSKAGSSASKAAERYSAIASSLSRYSVASKGAVLRVVMTDPLEFVST